MVADGTLETVPTEVALIGLETGAVTEAEDSGAVEGTTTGTDVTSTEVTGVSEGVTVETMTLL